MQTNLQHQQRGYLVSAGRKTAGAGVPTLRQRLLEPRQTLGTCLARPVLTGVDDSESTPSFFGFGSGTSVLHHSFCDCEHLFVRKPVFHGIDAHKDKSTIFRRVSLGRIDALDRGRKTSRALSSNRHVKGYSCPFASSCPSLLTPRVIQREANSTISCPILGSSNEALPISLLVCCVLLVFKPRLLFMPLWVCLPGSFPFCGDFFSVSGVISSCVGRRFNLVALEGHSSQPDGGYKLHQHPWCGVENLSVEPGLLGDVPAGRFRSALGRTGHIGDFQRLGHDPAVGRRQAGGQLVAAVAPPIGQVPMQPGDPLALALGGGAAAAPQGFRGHPRRFLSLLGLSLEQPIIGHLSVVAGPVGQGGECLDAPVEASHGIGGAKATGIHIADQAGEPLTLAADEVDDLDALGWASGLAASAHQPHTRQTHLAVVPPAAVRNLGQVLVALVGAKRPARVVSGGPEARVAGRLPSLDAAKKGTYRQVNAAQGEVLPSLNDRRPLRLLSADLGQRAALLDERDADTALAPCVGPLSQGGVVQPLVRQADLIHSRCLRSGFIQPESNYAVRHAFSCQKSTKMSSRTASCHRERATARGLYRSTLAVAQGGVPQAA